jgi:hypothetical protein
VIAREVRELVRSDEANLAARVARVEQRVPEDDAFGRTETDGLRVRERRPARSALDDDPRRLNAFDAREFVDSGPQSCLAERVRPAGRRQRRKRGHDCADADDDRCACDPPAPEARGGHCERERRDGRHGERQAERARRLEQPRAVRLMRYAVATLPPMADGVQRQRRKPSRDQDDGGGERSANAARYAQQRSEPSTGRGREREHRELDRRLGDPEPIEEAIVPARAVQLSLREERVHVDVRHVDAGYARTPQEPRGGEPGRQRCD